MANMDVHLRAGGAGGMQSSAAVAGRALIMLACVVGIPALALSGTSWSEMLKKLHDFRWPALLDLASASPSPMLGEAPRFVSSGPTAAPATGQSSSGCPGAVCLSSARAALPPLAPSPSGVVPAGYQASADLVLMAQPVVGVGGENLTRVASSADPFHSIQDRLRQLGATYYLLESWGNQQQMYRFYCKMAVGGSTAYTRYFEATACDPVQSMAEVLRQVETWREGGERRADGGDVAIGH
jgi:hypothetical protein